MLATAPLVLIGSAAPGLPGDVHENVAWAANWRHDANGDRVDDRIATGAAQAGLVLVHILYDRPTTPADVAALEAAGASRVYRFHHWDDVQAWIPQVTATAFGALPGVVAVERVEESQLALASAMPALRIQSSAGTISTPGLDHALSVHDTLGLRGEGQVIAILDTGIDNTHLALDDLDDNPATFDPKLVHRIDPASGDVVWGGVDTSDGILPVGCIDPPDNVSHGTHVAGIAAGTAAGQPADGAAPKAKLVDISLADVPITQPMWIPGISLAIDWILDFNEGSSCFGDPGDDTIDVASMSISISADPTSSINRKVTDLVRSGVVAVIAAGNDGPGTGGIDNAAEGAILVASSNNQNTVLRDDDALSGFSSRGPRATDADSDALDELRPDITAPGSGIQAALAGSGVGSFSQDGTSMATPMVAGIAALMLQANPALAPIDAGSNEAMGGVGAVPIRDYMQLTASYKTATEQDAVQSTATGKFGLPWNNGWGYGLIDAYGAVLAARDGLPDPPSACFSLSVAGLTVSVDASCSTAPPGETLTAYAWNWGDGDSLTGPISTDHTYLDGGVYTVTLSVTASNGRSAAATETITVEGGPGGGIDPDPSTPNLFKGVPRADSITVLSLAASKTYKVHVPAGVNVLQVQLDGPDCTGPCADDIDLRVGPGIPSDNPPWPCSSAGTGNDHSCAIASPLAGWWTVQVLQHNYVSNISFSTTATIIPETAYSLTASWT